MNDLRTENYWRKTDLYFHVNEIREQFHITTYPINFRSLIAHELDYIRISIIDFSSEVICAILSRKGKLACIGLNSLRNSIQQNFDCGHELLHYFFHPNMGQMLICGDMLSSPNTYAEWQANEGTSELLMPYKLFVPMVSEILFNPYSSDAFFEDRFAHERLQRKFGVSKAMIDIRINSLSYEIAQYQQNVGIDEIQLLSRREQQHLNIKVPTYNLASH